jgi:hypothetical protein
MSTDPSDAAAQKARAERLRKQVEELKEGPEEAEKEQTKEPTKKESPRDFIHRRMRELGEAEKD